MLANFEQRYFENEIKVWHGMYCDLQNIVHWHRECELIYIKTGSAKIGVNSNSYIAKAGDLIICTGGDMHYIDSFESGTVCDIIIFDGDFLRPIFRNLSLSQSYITSQQLTDENFNIESLFTTISDELKQENLLASEVIKAYLMNFFVMCVRKFGYVEDKSNKKTHKQNHIQAYQDLLEYIESNYAEIDFKKSAKFMHFTPQHFSKVFKDISGITLTDYLNYVRIEKSIALIQSTSMTITAIADKCGFNNIRSFNRIFKKITGTTPTKIDSSYQLSVNLHPIKNTNTPFNATISHSSLIIK